MHEVTGTKLSGPKNFTPYDFYLCACMQPHKRKESALLMRIFDVFLLLLLFPAVRIYEIYHIRELWINLICEHFTVL